MDILDFQDPPPLTATTCAICHEEQSYHVVTACCKPDAPSGHEPVVCFECFETMARASETTAVSCPLCRMVVRHFKKVLTADLRSFNTVLLDVEEQSVATLQVPVQVPATQLQRQQVLPHSPVPAPPAAQAQAAASPQPQQPQQPRTALFLFQHQVLSRESLRDDPMFVESLQRVEANVLLEAYRLLVRRRVYRRAAFFSTACNITLNELLRAPAHLMDDDGLCVSCLFPIHFHTRR